MAKAYNSGGPSASPPNTDPHDEIGPSEFELGLGARLAGWRQHLHANPGLSLHEGPTAAFVADRLRELGVDVTTGVGGHGVVGTIQRVGSERRVGLRADMDALPIQELNDNLPYRSTVPGVMHACGHDGHTAALLGAAILLQRDRDWTGTVHLVFQPAEEGGGGALAMISDGLFTRFPMNNIFGWHNWSGLAAGTIAIHDGAVMAAGAGFEIVFEGKMGHAGRPHDTRDPVLGLGHCIVALQTIVARNVDALDSAVVSVTKAQAFDGWNVIPRTALLKGTVRYLSHDTGVAIEQAIHRVAEGVALSFDLGVQVRVWHGIPVTANHPNARELAAAAAATVSEVRRDLSPSMGGEDFSWFLQQVPGAFVWIGDGQFDAARERHTAGFNFNDAILVVASKVLGGGSEASASGGLALDRLGRLSLRSIKAQTESCSTQVDGKPGLWSKGHCSNKAEQFIHAAHHTALPNEAVVVCN